MRLWLSERVRVCVSVSAGLGGGRHGARHRQHPGGQCGRARRQQRGREGGDRRVHGDRQRGIAVAGEDGGASRGGGSSCSGRPAAGRKARGSPRHKICFWTVCFPRHGSADEARCSGQRGECSRRLFLLDVSERHGHSGRELLDLRSMSAAIAAHFFPCHRLRQRVGVCGGRGGNQRTADRTADLDQEARTPTAARTGAGAASILCFHHVDQCDEVRRRGRLAASIHLPLPRLSHIRLSGRPYLARGIAVGGGGGDRLRRGGRRRVAVHKAVAAHVAVRRGCSCASSSSSSSTPRRSTGMCMSLRVKDARRGGGGGGGPARA